MWNLFGRRGERGDGGSASTIQRSVQHTPGRRAWTKFAAPDVDSAVDLARRLQSNGDYQYFRGQENSAWHALPSFMRLADTSEREAAKSRAGKLLAYLRAAAKAQGIDYSDDALIAIGQHYGLATPFLDLTTDPVVAASFACPPQSRCSDSPACLLLYSEKVIRSWAAQVGAWTGQDDAIELLRIDVANLWRLQAQSGLFLHIQVPNLCDYFVPDMIEFPHPEGGYVSQQCVLYPTEKSELEVQLDLVFELEAAEQAKADLRASFPNTFTPEHVYPEMAEGTFKLSTAVDRYSEPWVSDEVALHERLRSNTLPMENRPLRTLPDNYFPPAWDYVGGLLMPHPSWFGEEAERWLTTAVQRWSEARPADALFTEVDLSLFRSPPDVGGTSATPAPLAAALADRRRSCRFLPTHREWKTSNGLETDGAPTEIEERFGLVASNLWDGIRNKPLTDDLAQDCMSRFFWHARSYLDQTMDGRGTRFDEWLGTRDRDYIKVEFAAIGGHSQTSRVPCGALEDAVRDDLKRVVVLSGAAETLAAEYGFVHLTQMLYPQYLFDFEKFVSLYYRLVLPYQAFIGAITWRPHLGLCFNARQVKVFGMA